MPKSWSKKEERQYKHIKGSEKKRGRSMKRAKEIAARTVNKPRRLKGKTSNKKTRGTGNPNTSLMDRKIVELKNISRKLKIPRYSQMNKSQLIREIKKAS